MPAAGVPATRPGRARGRRRPVLARPPTSAPQAVRARPMDAPHGAPSACPRSRRPLGPRMDRPYIPSWPSFAASADTSAAPTWAFVRRDAFCPILPLLRSRENRRRRMSANRCKRNRAKAGAVQLLSNVLDPMFTKEAAEALKASYSGRSYYGAPDYLCSHCGASFWFRERITSQSSLTQQRVVYNSCCRGGRVTLPPHRPFPPPLAQLISFNGGLQRCCNVQRTPHPIFLWQKCFASCAPPDLRNNASMYIGMLDWSSIRPERPPNTTLSFAMPEMFCPICPSCSTEHCLHVHWNAKQSFTITGLPSVHVIELSTARHLCHKHCKETYRRIPHSAARPHAHQIVSPMTLFSHGLCAVCFSCCVLPFCICQHMFQHPRWAWFHR